MNSLRLMIVLLVGLAPALAAGQDTVVFDSRPRLYLSPSLSLNGGGFQAASASIAGGVMYEIPRLSVSGGGSYNAARKVNDGTGNNPHGHVRSLSGTVFARLRNRWLVGGSYGYGALSTTNYDKIGHGWEIGGGRDIFLSDVSMRLAVLYAPPSGPKHTASPADRGQGMTVNFMLPSPISDHRVFFTESVSVSRFSNGQATGSARLGLLFRF